MLKLSRSFVLILFVASLCDSKPNVVIIMADDMGSFDASYRGSNQFVTPNIDALAYHGVVLDRFYTPHMCTPSRASVMTGKYPQTVGMQNYVIPGGEAYGLGLDQKLMSNYFKDAGYKTHLVGKWHLGYFQQKYTPTFRGFDSFFGYYNGLIDYFNFTYIEPAATFSPGYDFRNNTEVNRNVKAGSYATDLFTDEAIRIIKTHDATKKKPLFLMLNHLAPHTGNGYDLLQAPQEVIDKFSYITDINRRKLAAMIWKLDDGIGKVVEALKDKRILDDTIIMFYSDNGGPTYGLFNNSGSNYPLRGQKNTPWEGAVRNLGLFYSPLIKASQRVHDGYFHTSDVLPTLASAAGFKVGKVDGFDQWKVLVNGGKSPRNEIVMTLDPIFGFSGIISDKWKFVNGTSLNGDFDGYLGKIQNFLIPPETYANSVLTSRVAKAIAAAKCNGQQKLTAEKITRMRIKLKVSCDEEDNPIISCNPLKSPCLFNIIDDPCERKNLADFYPATLKKLNQRMIDLVIKSAPVRRTFIFDPLSDPAKHEGTWTWWVSDSAY